MSETQGPSNLQLRVVSGIVLIAVTLLLTWLGGIWYRALCSVIGAAVLYEWTAMTLPDDAHKSHPVLLFGALAIVLAMLLCGVPALLLFVAIAVAVAVGLAHAAVSGAGFWAVSGLAYAAICAATLAMLRGSDAAGIAVTVFLFAVVWSTDILAYFVGRAVGGPKLAPSISPGKTWSGAVGGAIAAVVAGVVVGAYAGFTWTVPAVIVLVFFLSVASQLGDLFESRLKRIFAVKDSSHLIPGHGGVMDRIDGLAAAALVLYVVGAVVASADHPAGAFFVH